VTRAGLGERLQEQILPVRQSGHEATATFTAGGVADATADFFFHPLTAA
jgi:hypothetical protein